MQDEIEVKFLNVNIDEVRAKLTKLGAHLEHPMRMMRRVVIDHPDRRLQSTGDSWVRVRDEGDKITLTFKQTTEHEFGGVKEIEVNVSSYEDTIAILQKIGLIIHTDQETKRETWKLDDVEVVIDEWPWLNPFIEIEGPSKESVEKVATKMGYNWEDAIFGSVTVAYRDQYKDIQKEESISKIPEIKFSIERPDWFVKTKTSK